MKLFNFNVLDKLSSGTISFDERQTPLLQQSIFF